MKFKVSLMYIILFFACFYAEAAITPKETMDRAKAGKSVVPQVLKTKNNKSVELSPSPYRYKDVPEEIKKLHAAEMLNDRLADLEIFDAIDMTVLGPYDPEYALKHPEVSPVHYVPYIPMPSEYFDEYLIGVNISDEMKKVLFFKYDGKTYVRFFIHPSKTASYNDLIKKFGIVRDQFVGLAGASPRSLYVWDPLDAELKPFVAKTSLHFEIDGNVRTNPPPKVARSYLVNNLFAEISAEQKALMGFDFIPEVAQLLPRKKAAALIIREIPDFLLYPKRGYSWVPGHALVSKNGKQPPMLLEWLKGSRKKVESAAEFLRPLLQKVAYLLFAEGLKGEFHEQNNWHEIGPDGKPTGKILFKDPDGYRVDAELRALLNKRVDGLRDIFKPMVYSKFGAASGWSDDNSALSYDQNSYDTYIKHTYGYSFGKIMNLDKNGQKQLFDFLDRVMAEEVEKITGLWINPATLGSAEEDVRKGLEKVSERFRYNLTQFETLTSMNEDWKSKEVQKILAQEYERLRKENRGSRELINFDASKNKKQLYYVLHADLIEVRYIHPKTFEEKPVAFAVLFKQEDPRLTAFIQRLKDAGVKSITTFTNSPRTEINFKNICSGLTQ